MIYLSLYLSSTLVSGGKPTEGSPPEGNEFNRLKSFIDEGTIPGFIHFLMYGFPGHLFIKISIFPGSNQYFLGVC